MKNTSLFVLVVVEKGAIKEMRIIADGAEVGPRYKEAVKKMKLSGFGGHIGDIFFTEAHTLNVGQSSAVGDFNKTEVSVHRLKVE